MTVTGLIDINAIKEEIINDLRVNITDPSSRGSSASVNLSGNGSDTAFLINVSTAKAISSIEHPINTVLTFGTDYTFNTDYDDSGIKKLRIVFTTPPASGTDNIEVNYKYGETWVYPDYSQPQSTLSDFPRITVDVLQGNTSTESADGSVKESTITVSITLDDFKSERLDGLFKSIRERMLEKQKSWYYLSYLTPSTISPLLPNPTGRNKVLRRTADFDSIYNFEVVS